MNRIIQIGSLVVIIITFFVFLYVFSTQRQITHEYNYTIKKTIVIEGCQYIKLYNVTPFIHKGNCSNPIHMDVCVVDTFQIIHEYMEDIE